MAKSSAAKGLGNPRPIMVANRDRVEPQHRCISSAPDCRLGPFALHLDAPTLRFTADRRLALGQ